MKTSSLLVSIPFSFLAATAVPGCGGIAGSSYEGKDSTCQEFCDQAAECGDATDSDTCSEECAENEALSRSGQEVVTECYAEQDCDTSNPLALVDCLEDGLEDLPVSSTAQQFCSEGQQSIIECNDREISDSDVELCEESITILSDEVLMDLNECAEESCDDQSTCLFGVLLGLARTSDLESLGALSDAFGGELGDLGDLGDFGDLTMPSDDTGTGGTTGTGGSTSLGGSTSSPSE